MTPSSRKTPWKWSQSASLPSSVATSPLLRLVFVLPFTPLLSKHSRMFTTCVFPPETAYSSESSPSPVSTRPSTSLEAAPARSPIRQIRHLSLPCLPTTHPFSVSAGIGFRPLVVPGFLTAAASIRRETTQRSDDLDEAESDFSPLLEAIVTFAMREDSECLWAGRTFCEERRSVGSRRRISALPSPAIRKPGRFERA
ncbi:hypothetical protein C8F01DRAFT_1307723 [Mycena amicta]|nr:hypothetical protein C8F01DRAFT_1307723 [Mycena amicta]